jgi:hypothetical protein
MRIGLTVKELVTSLVIHLKNDPRVTMVQDVEGLTSAAWDWIQQFKPIASVTIPRYLRSYKSSEAAIAKYYEKGTGKKVPYQYCDKVLFRTQGIREPDGVNYRWKAFPCVRQKTKKMIDFLVDAKTEERIIANPKKVGKPRYQVVNGQDIYNGNISKAARNKLITVIKDQFRQFAMTCPRMTKYPLIMEVEVWDTPIDTTYNSKQDWDLGNRIFPYNKGFEDVLKKGDCGVIIDDSVFYLTGPPAPLFCPITNSDERKLVYKFYLDRRAIVLNHPDYQERLKDKLQ